MLRSLKVVPLCLGALLVLNWFPSRYVEAAPLKRGDVNSNGTIEISDAVQILGFLFLGQPASLACEDAADPDDNGKISLSDAVYLLGYMFLGTKQPAAPFEACGLDSTEDPLGCQAFALCDGTPIGNVVCTDNSTGPTGPAHLEDFGYNRLRVAGQRPLLVVLAEFAGSPALPHPKSYYDALVFNFLRPPSVTGYFLENSHGRFTWTRAGVGIIGPLQLAASAKTPDDRKRLGNVLDAAVRSGFNFQDFDSNTDGSVTTDELGILVIENAGTIHAHMRQPDPVCIRPVGPVNVCTNGAVAGSQASLMSLCHELSHLFGTIDLYSAGNQSVSLMGATIFDDLDNVQSFHLDPWHKLALGWCEPRLRALSPYLAGAMPAAQLSRTDGPILLYDPARGTREFFLLEHRSSALRSYDANVADNGLAIWHVLLKDDLMPDVRTQNGNGYYVLHTEAAPDLARGGSRLWHDGETTPALRWIDGTSTNFRVSVTCSATDGSSSGFTLEQRGWQDWSRIGVPGNEVPLRSTVTAVSRMPEQLDVFVVGFDGGVYSSSWNRSVNEGKWAPWFRIGPSTRVFPQGTEITAVSRNPDRLDIFGVGPDGGIFTTSWDKNVNSGRWGAWSRVGTGAAPDLTKVAAVTRGEDQIDIFVVGTDGGIYTSSSDKNVNNSRWSEWTRIGESWAVVPLRTPITAVSRSPADVSLFVAGFDGGVWISNLLFDGSWATWSRIHDLTVAQLTPISAVARSARSLQIFAVGADGAIYTSAYTDNIFLPADWTGWMRIGESWAVVPAGSAVTAVSRDKDHLDLFVTGFNGGIYTTNLDFRVSASQWATWFRLGTLTVPQLSTVTPVARRTEGEMDLFVVGSGGEIFTQSWLAP